MNQPIPVAAKVETRYVRIGTAGWSLPRSEQHRFPEGGSHLARYAARFSAVEINSSFHRSHRRTTWERWRDAVPEGFRFSVKMPKAVTHRQRLAGADSLVETFLAEAGALESKLACLLVQLPPSLAFEEAVAQSFFAKLRDRTALAIACEPRHESWFTAAADALLVHFRTARVAADPARVPAAGQPGGWRGLNYFRLHGSPRTYYSAYSSEFLANLVPQLGIGTRQSREIWCIFDNTTLGAATGNALELFERTGRR